MRAKEYSEQYRSRVAAGETRTDAARGIIAALIEEAYKIGLSRSGGKPQIYDRVLCPVLKEQDLKWRAIARELDWNPNGFRDLLKEKGINL